MPLGICVVHFNISLLSGAQAAKGIAQHRSQRAIASRATLADFPQRIGFKFVTFMLFLHVELNGCCRGRI